MAFYVHRSSFQPFPNIGGSSIVRSPVAETDSQANVPDTYSVQLNIICQSHWIQVVWEVIGGQVVNITFYILDKDRNLVDWNSLPVPSALFGQPDDLLDFEVFDDGAQLVVYPAYVAGGKEWTHLFKGIVCPVYDKMLIVSLEVTGSGNSSTGTFTSGAFDCELSAQGVSDLQAYQPDPAKGETVANLIAGWPQPQPPAIYTNEATNLRTTLQQQTGSDLKESEAVGQGLN